jgi:hypothetical protein
MLAASPDDTRMASNGEFNDKARTATPRRRDSSRRARANRQALAPKPGRHG